MLDGESGRGAGSHTDMIVGPLEVGYCFPAHGRIGRTLPSPPLSLGAAQASPLPA